MGPCPRPVTVRGAEDADIARVEALARVRFLLLELGCTDEEIDRAVEDDVLDLLVVDHLLVPTGHRLTQAEVAERTDIPLDVAKRFWRALGFLDVDDDEPAFTDMDIEAVQLFQSHGGPGHRRPRLGRPDGPGDRLVDGPDRRGRDGAGHHADPAWARATASSTPTSSPGRPRRRSRRWPACSSTCGAATCRRPPAGPCSTGPAASTKGVRPVMAVGFADMVGFTVLSQHLGDEELAAVVARFEELAHDTVVALGGRVVKMIGDEVMFVVQTATGAAQIGLSLAEAYAGDDLLSDVRVALAVGPVLVQGRRLLRPGGQPGQPAGQRGPSRHRADLRRVQARPSRPRGPTGIDTRPLRTRNLKDLGRVQMWKLIRAGTEPGADSRRTMRWERLGEVLRELDELRERGESGRHAGRAASAAGRSRAVAIPWGRRGNEPSNGVDRSAPQVDQPARATRQGHGRRGVGRD